MAIGVLSSTPAGAGGGDVVQSDPVRSFDFSAAHEQAMNYGESNTPSSTEQVVDTSVQPAVTRESVVREAVAPEKVVTPDPAEVTKVETTSEKKLATLADDDLVEIVVDGEKQTMPWKEARGFTMRHAAFTKGMQQNAAERKAIEDQQAATKAMTEEHAALISLLRDKNMLRQFVDQKYPDLLQAQAQVEEAARQVDPNDIATVGQINEARQALAKQQEHLLQQVQEFMDKREQAIVKKLQDAQVVTKLQGEIRTLVDGLFEAHPYINDIVPDAEDMLRFQVSKLDPRTPEATKEAFKQVFEGWVEKYKTTVVKTTKQAVIEKHKLETNNIQPAGGAHVQPQPQSFVTKNKSGKADVDWKALNKTALDMMNQK